ncbi:cytochrome o ubiquinol oxidase subunit IV [Devosia sp.]|jgi:cytochrome o ubiquinol oxidase operon protein cyoD|uniref:cytochrome o ubiquinol oxidase subunit IV n=1 Tax=Devosia sp. TaxID=1871048 RepID=UPI001AD08F32|nr:cytochrome o ubiquinol oxidase subunit IV [Devosia sp.]MBN9332947.1 cytochrome o ubiquinol oxidase subunit IV [Devosia sp.]
MSASTSTDTLGHSHAHPNPHSHGAGHDHGTRRSYLIGFALSVILTAIPFWLVMGDVIADRTVTTLLIMAFGVVQIFVHMVYFLHMNTKSEGGWTMMAAIFTIIIIVIALAGSLWVMFHLNTNMMPGHVMNPADLI